MPPPRRAQVRSERACARSIRIAVVDLIQLTIHSRARTDHTARHVERGVARAVRGQPVPGTMCNDMCTTCVTTCNDTARLVHRRDRRAGWGVSRTRPHYAMLCHAMLCHAMPCHAMPCHAMPCHAMPCYAMLAYAATALALTHMGPRQLEYGTIVSAFE